MQSPEEKTGWFAVALVGAIALSGLGWQWQVASGHRVEYSIARAVAADRLLLEYENATLRAMNATPAGLEAMRSDREALPRLREELDAVKSAVKQRKPKPSSGGPPPRIEALALPADEWRNAGRGSPRDAFETALWAAAGGDVNLLGKLLVLDPGAVRPAEELFASLPKSLQRQYAGPQTLIAWLTAADVTFGSMWVREEMRSGNTGTLRVLLQWSDKSRMPVFAFRRDAAGWSLVVPRSAVAKYAAVIGRNSVPWN